VVTVMSMVTVMLVTVMLVTVMSMVTVMFVTVMMMTAASPKNWTHRGRTTGA